MDRVKIGLVGFGTVGESFYRLVMENAKEFARRLGVAVEVPWVGVRDAARPRAVRPGTKVVQGWKQIVEDPDVPKNLKADGMFDHWVLWDIAPTAKGIAEGDGKGGMNETGTAGFMGPCPPDREHRYFFKLFALDTKLTGAKIAGKKDLEKAMDGHVLEKAELVGRYTKQ